MILIDLTPLIIAPRLIVTAATDDPDRVLRNLNRRPLVERPLIGYTGKILHPLVPSCL